MYTILGRSLQRKLTYLQCTWRRKLKVLILDILTYTCSSTYTYNILDKIYLREKLKMVVIIFN